MRGQDAQQASMFSYISLEERIPADHPLRAIRAMTDRALKAMSPLFDKLYAPSGRDSIPPERLLRALLLQVLFTIRSERQLMEQMHYNLLYRWFVNLDIDDPVWDVTVFSEPGSPAGRRCRPGIFRCCTGTGAGGPSALRRPLHGGRHTDRSLGLPQELQVQGRAARARGRRYAQSDGGLQEGEAQQRHPPLHHRP